MKTKPKLGRVRAALEVLLKGPATLTDEAFWAQFGWKVAGQEVNERTIMQLSAVWACTRLISEMISTLPLMLYERKPGGRVVADNHPIHPLIHRSPNADTTASVFWESVVASMLLRGNAFSEKQYIGNRLVALNFLYPRRLSITRGINGNLTYRYTEANGKQREIPESRIFRIPGFTVDGNWGLSAIEHGAGVFGSALAAANAANGTFESGLMPTVAFTMDRVIKPEHRDQFRESLKAITGALNAGKSPLLEAGMDTKAIGINPSDAQLLESRSFSVEEICRWFRVPPWMVGHTEKSTSWGTGIEQQMIWFLTGTLRPWLKRIEQSVQKDLLSPVDRDRYYAEFSIEGLLRADSAARAAFYSTALQNGWLNRNQVAAMENMPQIPGGDIYTVQSNLIPLDQLGNMSPADRAQAAMRAWLLGTDPENPSSREQ